MLKKISEEHSRAITISVVVIPVLWVMGILSSNTFGGFIHILPFLSVGLIMLKFAREEKTRPGDKGPRMKSSKGAPPRRLKYLDGTDRGR